MSIGSSKPEFMPGRAEKGDLYWAVIEHVRTWRRDDQEYRTIIDANAGKLDGKILKGIAIKYGVNRGICAKIEGVSVPADEYAKLLNERLEKWPAGLVARAKWCADVAVEAKRRGFTHGFQASGVTKLAWFARPRQWTPYDNYAQRAMRLAATDTLARMTQFYRELDRRGFLDIADQVQRVLDSRPEMKLHGTRVIDKFMMLQGAEYGKGKLWADRLRSECDQFIGLQSPDRRRAIVDLAEIIARNVDLSDFVNG